MLESVFVGSLYSALFIHVLLMVVVTWRLWKGENAIDRLMASDLLSALTMALLVVASLIHQQRIYMDIALGLAALGYVAIVTFAKYIIDKQIL